MKTSDSVKKLASELKRDRKGLRETYKSTIAVCFMDELIKYKEKTGKKVLSNKDIHICANNGAELFLQIFCGEIKYPEGR